MICAVLLGSVTSVESQQWTRFRGPNGSGVSDATTVPASWTDDDYNWKVQLPGEGHSSPVVWAEKLFLTSADLKSGERYLLCIDTGDGSVRWQKGYPFAKYKANNKNSFASHTPALDAQHVYTLWQSAGESAVLALDHDGNEVWQYELGTYRGGHGPGTSPIVYEDLVILCNDQEKGGDSFLIALDAATGKLRWKVERVGDRACYSTPCVYQADGREPEIVFTHSYRGITGVDPRSGAKVWELDVFGTHNQRAVGSPVIAGDLVIGSSGFTTGIKNVVAVKPDGAGGSASVKEVYRIQKTVPHVPTPLVYGDRVYLWADIGVVTCVDAASGEQLWQGRVGGNYYGSPVYVGGRLYCIDLDGVVVVLDAEADDVEVLSRIKLGEPSAATPAVSGGTMYLRTRSQLFSLGG